MSVCVFVATGPVYVHMYVHMCVVINWNTQKLKAIAAIKNGFAANRTALQLDPTVTAILSTREKFAITYRY